jgi:hypothetical protein
MSAGDAREARPLDLVALVTFDGEVAENQAVTRDRLGRRPEAPHPLSAAIEHWLGRGRHTWVSLRGRQVRGIATARQLATKQAWEVDALIDADSEWIDSETSVLADLLQQAGEAAVRDSVSHVLLRTRWDSPAAREAQRAGFRFAHLERLWSGTLTPPAAGEEPHGPRVDVREAAEADEMPLFQLYNRARPIESRSALAMTIEEQQALRELRWCGRNASMLVATSDGRVVGSMRVSAGAELAQFDLMVDPTAPRAAEALLDAAGELHDVNVVTLVDASSGAVESLLRRRGLEPSEEYAVLSRRSAKLIRETVRAPSGAVIPSGG